MALARLQMHRVRAVYAIANMQLGILSFGNDMHNWLRSRVVYTAIFPEKDKEVDKEDKLF